ncbi:MAG: hypothetical protein JOZ77_03495 [Candidatus Eremiobacteraeota bacterium]|nr:hypothetical protein [Candidatus Eremiobacteraeota bacterium]
MSIALLFITLIFVTILPHYPQWNAFFAGWASYFNRHPGRSAFVFIVLLVIAYAWIGKSWNPFGLALGEDGRLSSSKFQFLLWTLPIIFVFVDLTLARGKLPAIYNLPMNVMLALGLSLSTMVGAKGIIVSYIANNKISKASLLTVSDRTGKAVEPPINLADLVQTDQGLPDLTKAQMLAWTVVAIGVFLYRFGVDFKSYVGCQPNDPNCLPFPDIDTALMVLMGLGQGAYIGGKLVSASPPEIDTMTVKAVPTSIAVTLGGKNLNSGSIAVNGVAASKIDWKDDGTTGTATFPNPLAGTTIKSGDTVEVTGDVAAVHFDERVQVA